MDGGCRWHRVAGGKLRSQVRSASDRLADLQPATCNLPLGLALKLTFPGSNPDVRIEPLNPLTTTVSYFLGNDPAQWRPAVPVYGGVRYVDLYPGVDLVLGQADSFWRLEAGPGAATSQVRLQVEGAAVEAVDGGVLSLAVDGEPLSLALPQASFAYRASGVSQQGDPLTLNVLPIRRAPRAGQPRR